MSKREELLTPVGRLVQGSLYDPSTTDAEGKPLVVKTGTNMGQPRVDFYFGVAIPKGNERHWSETPWGAKIYQVGLTGFPNGQTQHPSFAWKITDGDSSIPNKIGKKPCDKEGYPRHWVLNFSSGFAPAIYNGDGTQQILEQNAVNLGDYIQVYSTVASNESLQQPGVYLNHSMVALARYGQRIILGADPKAVGFGVGVTYPAGSSETPLSQGFNPAPPAPMPVFPSPAMPVPMPLTPTMAVPVPLPVAPYPQILQPPVAPVAPPAAIAAPARVMTAAASGTYDAYIAAGWTDTQLIQHGFMQP